jgi:hypothetical protein
MLAYDEARHELVLFGGVGNDSAIGTWVRRGEEWTQLHPETEPPPRYGSAMVYDPIREEIVLFGGWGAMPTGGGNSTSDETWIWNGTDWRLATPTHSPPSRAFAAAGFDRVRGELVLFGGITGDGTGSSSIFGDTWTWDGSDWTQLTPETSPSRRHSVGSAFDPARGEFVIFGGSRDLSDVEAPQDTCEVRDPIGNSCVVNIPSSEPRPSSVVDETWVWDGTTWTQRTPEHAPRERMNPKLAWDPATGDVLLFGGVHPFGGATTDTWLWDGSDWTELNPPNHPSHRFGIPLASDPDAGRVVGFGGHQVTNYARDTWGWDGTTWEILDHPPTPEPRYFPMSAYDSARGEVVVFGGDGHRRHGDTWTFDGAWKQQAPTASPPARSAGTAAFDDARDEVVLFGGHSPQDLADTWLWDGTAWRQADPSTSPSARRHAAMVYDAVRGETVLFGGAHVLTSDECRVVCDSVQEFNDTWTWDGTTWTREQPADSPPALQNVTMVFDAARGETVLFGGLNGSNEFSAQTWTWNGVNWTLEEPTTVPPERADAQMSYDPVLQSVVMFSGLRPGSGPADLWAWDGTDWTEISATGAPRGRRGAVFVFDPEAGGTLLFGGTGGGPRDDTWLLSFGGLNLTPTSLALTVEGNGSNRVLRARLSELDDPTAGIAGATITFVAGPETIGSAVTDADGVATFHPPPRFRGGKHAFEARFEGDDSYSGSTASTPS